MTGVTAVAIVVVTTTIVSCRADGDSRDGGPSTTASATREGARAAERAEADAADLAALCVLASVPRPPRGKDTGLGSWNTALLATKSDKLVGWVQLAGAAPTKEDANWFFTGVDAGRFNMNVASGTCMRFRNKPERRTLVTAVIRISGCSAPYWRPMSCVRSLDASSTINTSQSKAAKMLRGMRSSTATSVGSAQYAITTINKRGFDWSPISRSGVSWGMSIALTVARVGTLSTLASDGSSLSIRQLASRPLRRM